MTTDKEIVSNIRNLLGRYGYRDLEHKLTEWERDDPNELRWWRRLAGLEVWGGAGAVWEVEPFHLSQPMAEGALKDYMSFCRLMVELNGLLEDRGLAALSARNAAILQKYVDIDGDFTKGSDVNT